MENAFVIATSRFRIFKRPIVTKVETAVDITKAIVVLHNFLLNEKEYLHENINQNVNTSLTNITKSGSNNYSKNAKQVRDDFKEYFNSFSGEVAWQNELVTRTV